MSSQQIAMHKFVPYRKWLNAISIMGCMLLGTNTWAQGNNRLERIETVPLTGDQVELRLHLSDTAPQPIEFVVDNPARISLDLPDTTIALATRRIDVKRSGLDTVTAAEANGRTRVVLNLDMRMPHETRVNGNVISVIIGSGANRSAAVAPARNNAAPESGGSTPIAQRTSASSGARAVKGIDFRRGTDGSARVIVELSDSRVPADLRQEGGRIVVTFAKTSLPDAQMQRLDVVDFATPVTTVDAVRVGDSARLLISATGDWEQIAYQSDNIYTIEVKPVVKVAAELEEKKEFTGERLNLNFQDIETRAVLQLLADTSGQDMVISDTVRGNVTLRLNNVPWDQALDIVLKTKGLGMRRQGSVIMIAPAAELSAREKEIMTAQKQISELAPLRTEYLQVNYAKAADLATLIKADKGKSLLSERGNVSIDERTNTLLLQDTSERLTDIRRLVSTLDIPIRQVQIEARIAIVNEDFSRDLGVRWGYSNINKAGSDSRFYSVSGSASTVEDNLVSLANGNPTINTGSGSYLVNLPAATPSGRLAMAVLGSSYLVDLELSAAEAEGRGEVVSSPRVVTSNQKEATIRQGVEIPYIATTSGGGGQGGGGGVTQTVTFKEAVLSLKVTPQITPDGRIILDLNVTKDSIGQLVPSGTDGGFIPSIDKREIITQVLIDDGETVVLGGILETERSESESKVPFLGNVPVLGYLFKSSTVTSKKRELLVFVTPKVLRETQSVR